MTRIKNGLIPSSCPLVCVVVPDTNDFVLVPWLVMPTLPMVAMWPVIILITCIRKSKSLLEMQSNYLTTNFVHILGTQFVRNVSLTLLKAHLDQDLNQ